MDRITRINQEITGHEKRIAELKRERELLSSNQVESFRARFPVVYVICETETPKVSGWTNYHSYTCDHGAFSTRALADECYTRHFRHVYRDHHDCVFEVKADATESVPDARLVLLDADVRPPTSPSKFRATVFVSKSFRKCKRVAKFWRGIGFRPECA